MYRTKKDVDKHVENLLAKLSPKEFKTRAYSVARLYFEVGDFNSCQKYVEQYISQKDNNAAAHRLLGQALNKLGQKEKALEQYKISLDIDPTQTSTILDICELLADDEVTIDPGRAKYWCEKAEATFPRHPVTFRLRERLVAVANPDPEALAKLLKSELAVRPKDAVLHCRLLKHYLNTNQIKEAFEHSCNVEFGKQTFTNNYSWYETLLEIVKHNSLNSNEWLYQLLLLTIRERICVLSLTETPNATSRSLVESTELLHGYDQAIEKISKSGAPSGFGEFHAALLQHHRGQFVFHAATLLLKRAKKDQLSWRDATKTAAPLMLIAWQIVPLDSKVNWLAHAPGKQQVAVHRWYNEGTYRCSQAGHYLLTNIQDKSQTFLDKISQICTGAHWQDKLYDKIFSNRDHLAKIKTSHFASSAFNAPVLRLPRRIEVEAYDADAQREYPNSLHNFVWILLNYKNYAHFKCSLFDMLTPTSSNYGPETLNKLDVQAFLYFATLTSHQQKSNQVAYIASDKPTILPAVITDLLCTLPQMKWWDCAYKFSQHELGTELTDIRATLSRGIEVVRCIDNHGLDPELLCSVASIFRERAKSTTSVEQKSKLEVRAGLYYSSALSLLEKIKSQITIKFPDKRLFDYTHKELASKKLNSLIEESRLYVAVNHFNDCEYDKVIDLLSNLKCPEAYYRLSQAYKRLAIEENNTTMDNNSSDTRSKYAALIIKAKNLAYKALDKIKDTEQNKTHPLYLETQQLIEEIETNINKIDQDLSGNNDFDGKYSSDENVSSGGSERAPLRNNNHMIRALSSTPKHQSQSMMTNYRTATDTQILETTRLDPQFMERIEGQIKNVQQKLAEDFMEQTKAWFEENRRLGTQIMSTIQSDIQNTTDQFKLLKVSVDHVKDQIDECRNECKDVGDLKKQIAELKKEVNKLKKGSSDQGVDESDLYNLDDDYRNAENPSNYAGQLPFQAPPVMPHFNQRLVPPFPVPPNPYQIYSQSLYNLYSQYSQFPQNTPIPGGPLFDPTKAFPGIYPTDHQSYLDMAHLAQAHMTAAPAAVTVPPIPPVPSLSTAPAVPVQPLATTAVPSKQSFSKETKDTPRSLPANVVITSSDPLPTSATGPAPILSVTIPPKHIKGTVHNYQIPMPSHTDSNVASPPVFSFPTSKSGTTTTQSSVVHWNQSNIFKSSQPIATPSATAVFNTSTISDAAEKSVVDGSFTGESPNVSLNKSRTLSERSNTSVENYDPCPDFKPIIPLPDEVKVTTGEEDEMAIFSSRAKLFRFDDKQWKERGIGDMKLLKHKATGKVRVLMRREQVHKICANHIITPDIEIQPMQNESKAYFWVANDFADETVVLEKFCIRFKTAEIASNFYETFKNAQMDASILSPQKVSSITTHKTEVQKNDVVNATATATPKSALNQQIGKTQVGGFTFSSTPTFKPVAEEPNTTPKPTETPTTKIGVFSNLTFKTTTSSPFSNLFGTTASPVTSSSVTAESSPAQKQDTSNKLNTSDAVEEFEPTAEFKPVIPLPALVDHKTGEEDEIILFEHRAKLLRYDSGTKEWKERGLGNIKLLANKESSQKIRLLMRREQIMKVCCNHTVTKDMTFQKMPNVDKAVTWCANDFSEGELVTETFCLRFKTVEICNNFIEAITSAQSKMKDEAKAAKEKQNAAKQNNTTGFGDKFKPKAGSWHCDACYTNNLETFSKCACCEQPRPGSGGAQEKTVSSSTPPANSWGDKFKPKAGSWECSACLIRNEAGVDYCTACDSPKDPSMPKKETKLQSDNAPKFSFGIPPQTTNVTPKKEIATPVVMTPTPAAPGWGDKFKPKEGSWECKECLVRNDGNADKCSACTSPNPSATNTQETTSGNVTQGAKYNFFIPPSKNIETSDTKPVSSIFDGTGAHAFKFGIPSANTQEKGVVGFGVPSAQSPINLASSKNEPQINITTPGKPALLPTPQTGTSTPFGGKETHATFDFVFKPKTPPKGKSPMKSPKAEGDESDDNEYASEDEGHHIHFNPIVPLPDKIDVVTGEENEVELYGHRAKLYRYLGGEWKERGLGVVKILKHKGTGKLRVVMRREQVHKICLNHALTSDVTYTRKDDDKTWLFTANDYSEGELSLQQFCLRFKTKEIALEFKEAVDNAREGKIIVKEESDTKDKDTASDDVVFISEILATSEEKQKAKDLMLPENFFTYKTKEPCKGCRGCEADDDSKSECSSTKSLSLKSVAALSVSTPVKSSPLSFQSPSNSFYGTPANFDKTADFSLFRTPLGSLGSNTNSASPATPTNSSQVNDSTNKENTLTEKNVFGGNIQSNLFTTPQTTTNIFTANDTQSSGAPKTNILAAPKFNALNTSGEEKKTNEAKIVFGTAVSKSMFGENPTGSNKPIFGFSANKTTDSQNSENVSIFGGSGTKTGNLFTQGGNGNLFGQANNQQNANTGTFGKNATIFNSNPTQSSTGNSVFGSTASQPPIWSFSSTADQKKPDVTLEAKDTSKVENKPDSQTESNDVSKDSLFKVDSSLSFAALKSSATESSLAGFNAQKKADFQWEGAGQQLFGQKANKEGDKSTDNADESGAGADEEYDPHYEPIVPLPDKIVVTTGEEDEEKMFNERSKLFRFDDKTREWKERGVGELKVLHHPQRNTYRLLLRREQVHKAVLNMLIHADLELLPMNSDPRAWTWAGSNFAENPQGEQETLALRFKSVDLATKFKEKVVECTRALQAAAAQVVKEEKETTEKTFEAAPRLRLPKHLESSARADTDLSAKVAQQAFSFTGQPIFGQPTQQPLVFGQNQQPNVFGQPSQQPSVFGQPSQQPSMFGQPAAATKANEASKQVTFQEPTEEQASGDVDDEEYDQDEYDEDYDYYNEETTVYFECMGEAVIEQGASRTTCESAHAQVLFDQEIYSAKILITDEDTGEILADMLIHADMHFQMEGASCKWSGTDYTSNTPVDKTVTLNFADSDTAVEFYDSCETTKGAPYASTEPES